MCQSKKYYCTNFAILLFLQLLSISADASTFTVTSIADSGAGSLRQAIIDANNNAGADEVNFDIAEADCDAAGVCHIAVLSDLSIITDALLIDGTAQAQYGTAPVNVCATLGAPSYMRIELNTSGSRHVFALSSPEASIIKGLSIGGESSNASVAVSMRGHANHWVNCNHLGVNAEGTEKLGVTIGVALSWGPQGNNGIVGTNSDGLNDASERNVIAASNGINHNSFSNYIIAGNYFGLTADGLTGLESTTCIFGGQNSSNRIGSNLDGIADDIERNIFGQCNTAIFFSNSGASQVKITGNWFGVNANRTSLANGTDTAINLDSSFASSNPSYLVASNWIDSATDSAINIKQGARLAVGSTNNCITNSVSGLVHSGTSVDQPFINNYWGDASGPSGLGAGTGASIVYSSTGTISYDPWSTTMPSICSDNMVPSTTEDTYIINEDETLTANDVDGSVNDSNDDGVLANDTDPESDTLTVVNPGTFTATGIGGSITIAIDGTFVYAPPANVSGTAGLVFDITDAINVVSSSLTINVLPVNDAPSFEVIGDIDATNQVGIGNTQLQISNFTHSIVFGPSDENSQNVLDYNLVIFDPPAILNSSDISNNGTLDLDFTLNFGVALIEATLQDNGGTANGGVDTSTEVEFLVAHFDLIFADGFETSGGLRLFDYLESVSTIYPHNNNPIYDFNNDGLTFYGHRLQLDNDYSSTKTMMLVHYWLQAVLIKEDSLGDYDLDGILNIDDKKPFDF